jgi:hypothetical protein
VVGTVEVTLHHTVPDAAVEQLHVVGHRAIVLTLAMTDEHRHGVLRGHLKIAYGSEQGVFRWQARRET